MFDLNLSELKAKAKAVSSRPVIPNLAMKDEVEEQEDEKTVEADLALRILEREKERKDQETLVITAIKVQRLFRQKIKRKEELLKERDLPEGKDHLDSTEDRLSMFKTDSSACTICGVDFQDTSEKQPEGFEGKINVYCSTYKDK
jgi:hypothetical protein